MTSFEVNCAAITRLFLFGRQRDGSFVLTQYWIQENRPPVFHGKAPLDISMSKCYPAYRTVVDVAKRQLQLSPRQPTNGSVFIWLKKSQGDDSFS